MFSDWSQSLPSDVEVCAVQLPGRGARLHETLITSMSSLIEQAAIALQPELKRRPFAFFGHSLGALIAFELARHLRRNYQIEPIQIFVSGRSAPQIPDTDPPSYDLPDVEFRKELQRLNGTPAEVLAHAQLMQLVLPMLRADFELAQTYVYSQAPPLNCPITALGGYQDAEVRREDLEAWRDQTVADFRLCLLPGDHFFIHSAQSLLLAEISKRLDVSRNGQRRDSWMRHL